MYVQPTTISGIFEQPEGNGNSCLWGQHDVRLWRWQQSVFEIILQSCLFALYSWVSKLSLNREVVDDVTKFQRPESRLLKEDTVKMWIPVYKRSTPRSATMSSPGWAFKDVSLGLVLGALQNPWFFLYAMKSWSLKNFKLINHLNSAWNYGLRIH